MIGAAGASGAQRFTSGANVVEVYASVTDAHGEPVLGLTRQDFEVLEAGQPQVVSTFIAGDVPLSVALAVDRSFSMAGPKLALARNGAMAFLDALAGTDQAMIVGIGSRVEILAPLSGERAAMRAAVSRIDAFGTTGLHDAIVGSMDAIQTASGRRALVLLSDGDDRYSDTSAAETLQRARQSDVMIYPIALGPRRPPLFAELAILTGGRSFHAPDGKGLPDIVGRIARELRQQYLIGYEPSRPIVAGANEWRAIAVRVNRPGLQVRARDGYVAR